MIKLKFKDQKYQNESVQSVVDCFEGQEFLQETVKYNYAIGNFSKDEMEMYADMDVYKNVDIILTQEQLLKNIRDVQEKQKLPLSNLVNGNIQNTFLQTQTNKKQDKKQTISKDDLSCLQLNIEMETGTGKTYCYIKTIFELNKKYAWTKFIIVVPSIAIREGVKKSMEITTDHFYPQFDKKIRYFIYDSKHFSEIENFSSDNGINVMIINVQAFNATGKDNRRIYEQQDNFGSRKPIDVLSACRPILILDEPQKMEGAKTLSSLTKFNPLFVLRYSATHKTIHNKIYRLDAVDAYNQKLVKKINVYGIQAHNKTSVSPYLFFQSVHTFSDKPPHALFELEQQYKDGTIKRITRRLNNEDNLYQLSNKMEVYRDNYVVANIDAGQGIITFANGNQLKVGDVIGNNLEEKHARRIQIKKTIEEHFNKEERNFKRGIKTLSLFFIDKVEKYRNYKEDDTKGEYARIFEEEYKDYIQENKKNFTEEYRKYVEQIEVEKTHNGYFSIDKKTKQFVDSDASVRGENIGLSNDTDAYDLILKDKERLLSFDEPTRFIFSHSALREGWDNPNVFVLCTLKQSDNMLSRRQEIGRGLRLCVNEHGERMDEPDEVHQINVLTVVASESYTEFVTNLQDEIRNSIDRPKIASYNYFLGKNITNNLSEYKEIDGRIAYTIYTYLLNNEYIDTKDYITTKYTEDKQNETLVELPESLQEYKKSIFEIIDQLYQPLKIDRTKKYTNKFNKEKFNSKEFQELWLSINKQAFYQIDNLKTETLIENVIKNIDENLNIPKIRYELIYGEQKQEISNEDLQQTNSIFENKTSENKDIYNYSYYHSVEYDLIDMLVEKTGLKRNTIGEILGKINKEKFQYFQHNPELFIGKIADIINEEKRVKNIVCDIQYEIIDEAIDIDIFSETEDIYGDNMLSDLKKHVFSGLKYDSNTEQKFAKELESKKEIVVYSKLPRKFTIPTMVGNYNPDWAIVFNEENVKHVYFVAETKGSTNESQLRSEENIKIGSAKKFFEAINEQIKKSKRKTVKYGVVDSVKNLFDKVNTD